ncbi:MAG TPA: hypothetical protein VNK52_06540 [Hyphomicrobiaceae bacterium]|nr:hypothetical protein [Hyphomicrobiaceae bacterium]
MNLRMFALCLAVGVAAAGLAQRAAAQGGPVYELSQAELALDCRRLTGRMQVRILQLREHAQNAKSSEVARLAQQTLTPLTGGSLHGANPDLQYQRDLAMLHAYNRRLAEKKCPTFNLEAELQPQPVTSTPRPVVPKRN